MKIKRLISLILVIGIVCSISASAVANDNESQLINDDIQGNMLRVLSSIEHEKAEYGLESVDFTSITLGKEIPVYRVEGNKLILANTRFIPIVSEGQLVSLFYLSKVSETETYVQLSNELVAPITAITGLESFAVVYDDTGAHIYSEGELTRLTYAEVSTVPSEDDVENSGEAITAATYNEIDLPRTDNVVTSVLDDEWCLIETSAIVADRTINADAFSVNTENTSRALTGRYLPVDIIVQPENTNICWAIAITSIANFIFDNTWTYDSIVSMFTGGVDRGLSIDNVIYNFNYWFDADYGYGNTTSLDTSEVLELLLADYPLYGHFTKDVGTGSHAVVIRGVNTSLNTFSVMNPSPTTSGYTAGTIGSDGKWHFISAHSGNAYTLGAAGYYLYP